MRKIKEAWQGEHERVWHFIHFKTIFTLLTRPFTHDRKQRICTTTTHGLGCHQPLTSIQQFWALSKFWFKDQCLNRWDQDQKIVHLLCPKGTEAWKSFTWEDPTYKGDPASLQQIWKQVPNHNTQCSYREEAYNLKQEEDETVEQLEIRLTNILLECSYHKTKWTQGKMRKCSMTQNTLKASFYMKNQPLTLAYHVLLDRSKGCKRALAYYRKSQESTATTETSTIAAVKAKASRSHHPKSQTPTTR